VPDLTKEIAAYRRATEWLRKAEAEVIRARRARVATIEAMWRKGASQAEIARQLG
jgi:hypothetical protein